MKEEKKKHALMEMNLYNTDPSAKSLNDPPREKVFRNTLQLLILAVLRICYNVEIIMCAFLYSNTSTYCGCVCVKSFAFMHATSQNEMCEVYDVIMFALLFVRNCVYQRILFIYSILFV